MRVEFVFINGCGCFLLVLIGRGEIALIPSWSKPMVKEKYILTPKVS